MTYASLPDPVMRQSRSITDEQIHDLFRDLIGEVKRYVAEAAAPLIARIAELERREIPKGVDAAAMEAAIAAALSNVDRWRDAAVDDAKLDARIAAHAAAHPAAPAEPGKDGVGLAGALIDQDGVLVLTLSDGTLHKLGRVAGKDGDPGKDGKDGFGFDTMEVVQLNERDVVIRFVRGEEKKEFPLRLAGFVDRGVYKPDVQYEKGDGATWGGSLWLAQRETKNEKPDGGSEGWRLAVKRGRDGKDGRTLLPVPTGPVKSS